MQFWLYPNLQSQQALALRDRLQERLGSLAAPTPEAADMVIVLGGDGACLRAARAFHQAEKPFWVVNCGHLGYLSDCGAEQDLSLLDQVLRGEYHLEHRTQVGGVLSDGRRVTALNELLFHRGACVHTLAVEVQVNGSLALRYRGDGLLVCTPSGSTAYNLSAGGPVLMPEMELLALTPICAQALSAAPIVVSAHDRVRVSWRMAVREGPEEWPDLTCDGQQKLLLPMTGSLEIGDPPPKIHLVRTQTADFYARLQHRMHWNADEKE